MKTTETKSDLNTTQSFPGKAGIPMYNCRPGVKSINLSGDKLVVTSELPCVFCDGVQYYDLKNILFINNSGIAGLIDLLKSLLEQGVETRFINVNEKIREKIRSMGLDTILTCI